MHIYAKIRERLMAAHDADKVTIKKNGEVHVRGRMPNTNKHGWFFAGFVEGIIAQIEDEERFLKENER